MTTRQTRDGFVVGTRGSALARWQTEHTTGAVQRARARAELPDVAIHTKVITTQGDTNLADRLAGQLEKGFFTREIEEELLAGDIDWAVHSLKDLPTHITAGLDLVAVLPRENPADLLVVRPSFVDESKPADRLPVVAGCRIGTSSLRREALIRTFAPSCQPLPLRGNVPTRVDKLRSGAFDAIVLAGAGVRRLDLSLQGLRVFELHPSRWHPAPGQGAIAVEARADDAEVRALLAPIHDERAALDTGRERALLALLEGGCTTPFGAWAHGDRAWIGRAGVDGTWHEALVPLPARPTDVELRRALAALDAVSADRAHTSAASAASAASLGAFDDRPRLARPL